MENDILFNRSNSASVKRQRLYQFLLQVNWRSCVAGIIFGSSLSILLSLSLFLIIAPYMNDKSKADGPFAAPLKDIDGIAIKFSDWQWGSCSKTCGIGVQEGIRTSICPQNVHCVDNETEILRRHCISEHCSVDGKWSVWMQEPCSVTCGVGTRLRHRQCSNPHPQYGGKNCTGKSIDHINCLQPSCCPGLTDNTRMNCAGGWMRRDDFGACFCFSRQRLSWNSAQAQCKMQSGSLADIYSENEAVWLADYSRLHTGSSVWIGGKRNRYRYMWFTSGGRTKTMNYTRWAPGEPKFYDPGNRHFICVNLWPEHQYKWDDFDCNKKLNFICKTYL